MSLYPKMSRPSSGRLIGGVAAGVAEHLNVPVLWVRVALTVLAFGSGIGMLLYAGLWVYTPVRQAEYAAAPKWQWGLIACALLGALGITSTVSGMSLVAFVPLILAGVGALLAWLAYDSERGVGILVVGALLVLAGVVCTALFWEGGSEFAAALLMLVGLGAWEVPLLLKMHRQLQENQRAEIASRLHDSVLQTLALIQKRAEDPQEVARLARSQERQLRAWLFDAPPEPTVSTFRAIELACGEAEDLCGVRIRPVTVGADAPLSDATKAAIQAAREAMVNAGKHAGVNEVDVYAESIGGELSLFVRDRGCGFDMTAVAQDRHGIRDSIIGRVESAGGRVEIHSTPGHGTEVEIAVEL